MKRRYVLVLVALFLLASVQCTTAAAAPSAATLLRATESESGVCVLLGEDLTDLALKVAEKTQMLVQLQVSAKADLNAIRAEIDNEGFLGTRIWVDSAESNRIPLADNLADALVVGETAATISREEMLRVLRPGGVAFLGSDKLVKPFPEGLDDWSHPYHGPDNNPVSNDQFAVSPYLTQFLGEPRYAPVPQVAVASAGRIFKAFGNVAFKPREEKYLNTLIAFNGFNGAILWTRPLPEGIPVHRNGLIATPETLYLAEGDLCVLLDAATGREKGRISPREAKTGKAHWKWMAIEDGALYTLTGEPDPEEELVKWNREAHGWPWNKISPGYNSEHNEWGYATTLTCIDIAKQRMRWQYDEPQGVDSRSVSMRNGKLYLFQFGRYLSCVDAETGALLWRKSPENAPEIFAILGEESLRQGYATNWRTTAYTKCSDDAVYFAGPQVNGLATVSANDGSLLWTHPYNNFQLILRDDALYAIGGGNWEDKTSKKFDLLTGKILADLDFGRRACSRVTAATDAIFCRAMGGSQRLDAETNTREWISPMRAQCQDGVTIANGILYWWPSVCDCQLSLYGVTALGPAGDFDFTPVATDADRLVTYAARPSATATDRADWPTFKANNQGTATNSAMLAEKSSLRWEYALRAPHKNSAMPTPTPPIAAGDLVYVADSAGVVQAIDASNGTLRWKAYTGGAVRFPPTLADGRVFVGSGDGHLYAFDAASGAPLWRFRLAPVERKIPVYGQLLSTWPVASGVLEQDGTVYAAAGIVNYDGTYVFALDAATGTIKWQNNNSGHLDKAERTGVSVQGHLLIRKDKLYLAGGTAVSPAVYDLKTGKCLNAADQLEDAESIAPRGWELSLVGNSVVAYGRPIYTDPAAEVYDESVKRKIHIAPGEMGDVVWLDNANLARYPRRLDPELLDRQVSRQEFTGHVIRPWGRFDAGQEPAWSRKFDGGLALAQAQNALVHASAARINALRVEDGETLWEHELPSKPVAWGVAIDRKGDAVVSLEDGRVLCFGGG